MLKLNQFTCLFDKNYKTSGCDRHANLILFQSLKIKDICYKSIKMKPPYRNKIGWFQYKTYRTRTTFTNLGFQYVPNEVIFTPLEVEAWII